MEINLSKDSVVNHQTGEVSTPSEFLMNLRQIEVSIARCDDEIGALRADLKRVRDARENLVAQLRAGIRDGEVLPLLEVLDRPADDGRDVVEDGS